MKRIPVLLALFLLAAACGTSSPAPSTYNLPIGAMITMNDGGAGDDWNVTVNSIKNFTTDKQLEPPADGYHFIVVDVTYTVTNGFANAYPYDWEAKDPTGSVSPTDVATMTLPASTVAAPNRVRGTVVLEIRNGSAGSVVYSSGFAEKASWSFSAAEVA